MAWVHRRAPLAFVVIFILGVFPPAPVDAFTTNNRPAYGIRAMTYRFGYDTSDGALGNIPGLVGRLTDVKSQISRAATEWSGVS